MDNKANQAASQGGHGPHGQQVLYQMSQATNQGASGNSFALGSSAGQGSAGSGQNATQAQASALINQAAAVQKFQQQQSQVQQFQQRMAQQSALAAAGQGTSAPGSYYSPSFGNFKLLQNAAGMTNPSAGMQQPHQLGLNAGAALGGLYTHQSPGLNGLSLQNTESQLRGQAPMLQKTTSEPVRGNNSQFGGMMNSQGGMHQKGFNEEIGASGQQTNSQQMHQQQQFNPLFMNSAPGLLGGQGQGQFFPPMPSSLNNLQQQNEGTLNSSYQSQRLGGMQGNVASDVTAGYQKSQGLMNGASSGQMNSATGGMLELPQSALMSNSTTTSAMHGTNSFADQGQSYPFFKRKENSPNSQIYNSFAQHQQALDDVTQDHDQEALQSLKHPDVLKTYGEKSIDELRHLIFYGGLDTGVAIGNLEVPQLDKDFATNQQLAATALLNRQNQGQPPVQHANKKYKYADRFIGPFCRHELNRESLLGEYVTIDSSDERESEGADAGKKGDAPKKVLRPHSQEMTRQIMLKYFDQVNSSMHLTTSQPSSRSSLSTDDSSTKSKQWCVESECFSQDFSLPASYEITKFRPSGTSLHNGAFAQASVEKCKLFPDAVLFYIFYTMPHDKAQLNAANELKSRKWVYHESNMKWFKLNFVQTNIMASGKSANGKKGGKNSARTEAKLQSSDAQQQASARTVQVFNPMLWREETLSILDD